MKLLLFCILLIIFLHLKEKLFRNEREFDEYLKLKELWEKADSNRNGKVEAFEYQQFLKTLLLDEEIAGDNNNPTRRTFESLIDDYVKEEYYDTYLTFQKLVRDLESNSLMNYVESRYSQRYKKTTKSLKSNN